MYRRIIFLKLVYVEGHQSPAEQWRLSTVVGLEHAAMRTDPTESGKSQGCNTETD